MRSTIDAAGRIVVPKSIRDRLRLGGGSAVEITERDGVIEIAPIGSPVEIVETAEGPVARPLESVAPLTDDELFDTIDAARS